jgi:hypothetical protein
MQEITYRMNLAGTGQALFRPYHLGVVYGHSGLAGLGQDTSAQAPTAAGFVDSLFGGAKNVLDAITGAGASRAAAEEARRTAESIERARSAEAGATAELYKSLPGIALGVGGLVVAGVVAVYILKR